MKFEVTLEDKGTITLETTSNPEILLMTVKKAGPQVSVYVKQEVWDMLSGIGQEFVHSEDFNGQ